MPLENLGEIPKGSRTDRSRVKRFARICFIHFLSIDPGPIGALEAQNDAYPIGGAITILSSLLKNPIAPIPALIT